MQAWIAPSASVESGQGQAYGLLYRSVLPLATPCRPPNLVSSTATTHINPANLEMPLQAGYLGVHVIGSRFGCIVWPPTLLPSIPMIPFHVAVVVTEEEASVCGWTISALNSCRKKQKVAGDMPTPSITPFTYDLVGIQNHEQSVHVGKKVHRGRVHGNMRGHKMP